MFLANQFHLAEQSNTIIVFSNSVPRDCEMSNKILHSYGIWTAEMHCLLFTSQISNWSRKNMLFICKRGASFHEVLIMRHLVYSFTSHLLCKCCAPNYHLFCFTVNAGAKWKMWKADIKSRLIHQASLSIWKKAKWLISCFNLAFNAFGHAQLNTSQLLRALKRTKRFWFKS